MDGPCGKLFRFLSECCHQADAQFTRMAANIVAITNGSTGPGILAIDKVQGTPFERLKMEWAPNVARIGTSKEQAALLATWHSSRMIKFA